MSNNIQQNMETRPPANRNIWANLVESRRTRLRAQGNNNSESNFNSHYFSVKNWKRIPYVSSKYLFALLLRSTLPSIRSAFVFANPMYLVVFQVFSVLLSPHGRLAMLFTNCQCCSRHLWDHNLMPFYQHTPIRQHSTREGCRAMEQTNLSVKRARNGAHELA